MAKILVADDNSNIQKMVGLALKDQGIDVVAVGNGEAAVRKISDMRPDLVLADVFMPVRNGYEVCEYVKTDASLAHIPVILLVGAFDPLDEQEAQRVGADGVLKKPFVPPDPLISMVKSALLRAGAALMKEPAVTAPAAASLAPLSSFAAERDVLSLPNLGSIPLTTAEPAEHFPEMIPAPAPALSIPEESQPLAFGDLLKSFRGGTPSEAAAEEEIDPSFLPARNPEFDVTRSWGSAAAEEAVEEEEEEASSHASWRRDGAEDSFEDNVPSRAVPDWRETVFASAKEGVKTEVAPPAAVEEIREAAAVTEAKQAPSFERETVAAPSFSDAAWTAAMSPSVAKSAHEIEVAPVEAPVPASVTAEAASVPTVAPLPMETERKPWFSVPTNPWDAEVQKSSRLSETWATMPASAVATEVVEPAAPASESHEALEAAKRVACEVAAEAKSSADIDAMVAKVLAKMTPDMLQSVTRDLLKPVVEAIVRGELDSKK